MAAPPQENSQLIYPETKFSTKRPTSSCGSSICTKRWQLSIIMFFGLFLFYSMRVNLSVAIVSMVNSTQTNSSDFGALTSQETGEFNWAKSTQSDLLASYFYGYLVLQIPGGYLAAKFGGSRLIFIAILLSSICTLVLPVSARHNLVSVYVLRVLVGFFGGVCSPCCQAMWGRWAPEAERTKLTTLANSGGYVGTVVTFAASGFLVDYGFDGGWPSIFYITEPPVPWKSILQSLPFWSLIINIIALAWIDFTFVTSLPQYMKDVLDFDIQKNGLLSSIPFVGQAVSCMLCGPVADWMLTKGLSTRFVRCFFQTFSVLGIAACLIGVGYITVEYRYIGVALLGVAGVFSGLQNAGYVANFIDIAPRFTGVMYGTGNCLASVTGFVTPIVAGAMTQHKSREEWQQVFYVCVGVCLFAALVFVLFSSGHVQEWALDKPEEIVIVPETLEDSWEVEGDGTSNYYSYFNDANSYSKDEDDCGHHRASFTSIQQNFTEIY